MTTLNTIIEEEVMNEIEREVNMLVAECLEARDCSRIANVLETVEEKFTTAIQRAYEAGRISWLRSEIEKLEGEKKGLVTLNCYGNCNPRCHDSGKDILLTSIITWYKKELSGSQE